MTSGEPTSAGRILLLGGTAEGRELAAALTVDAVPVISSLAGRVSSPRLPPGEVRVGGFGGIVGLSDYLAREQICAVIDATHPFAARITANAVAACASTGTPLLVLRRPGWAPVDGDRWTTVPDLSAAARALTAYGPDRVVLLTVGRQGVGAFADGRQRFYLRAVDPPQEPLPARSAVILDRGPFTVDGERQLLRRLEIDVVVTKNSGGPMTSAKLVAARDLALPVIVVDRPAPPIGVPFVDTVDAASRWAQDIVRQP
jgi:precorrin-6A/cobalt-precorrin-6A reductase